MRLDCRNRLGPGWGHVYLHCGRDDEPEGLVCALVLLLGFYGDESLGLEVCIGEWCFPVDGSM
jgi:hypothetical protein